MAKTRSDPFGQTPPGLMGWVDELDTGGPVTLAGTESVKLKIVSSPRRVAVYAVSAEPGQARRLLIEMGFESSRIRRLLCG